MAEGGIALTCVLIIGTWYTQSEIALRINIWYCGNGLAIIIQSVLSYGIGHIHTGIPVFKWFYIILGLVGIFWSAIILWLMPDNILTAKFLSEQEKIIALERIRANRTGIQTPEWKWAQFREALLDVKIWWAFCFTIAYLIPETAVANFGSLIIKGFGFGTFESSLLKIPLGCFEIIGLLFAGFIAERYPGMRCVMKFVVNIPGVIGAALINTLPESDKVGRLIAFYITDSTNATMSILWALNASNFAGHTKRTACGAISFIAYALGFIIGPQFFLGSQAPTYPFAFRTMLVCFSICSALPVVFWLYITWENRRKIAKARACGGEDAEVCKEEFLHLTDKEQIHFVYVK
jgi:MFS transporter, ACS family, allantoate permease